MKTFKALFIDNGIIKANEFPVEPERHADNLCAANACDHPGAQKGTCECEQYEQAFASAKANAAVCKDQALAKQIVKDAVGHDLDYMTNTDGCMYFIPDGWDYRVEERKIGGRSVKDKNGIAYDYETYTEAVAKLYRTDPLQQLAEQESQEALWSEAEDIIAEAMGTYKTSLTVGLASYARKELEKHFTITRKP